MRTRDIPKFPKKPEMKKPEFVEKRIFVLVELFVYLFTYRFHISFVISTVCVIFQGYGQELNKVGCVELFHIWLNGNG